MIINQANLDLVFAGIKTVFNNAFDGAPTAFEKVAMTVTSSTREETYPWLGQFPMIREWIGDRHVKGLEAHSFAIKNKKFESTVEIERDDISDDRYGVYTPFISEMGRTARQHPDTLIFNLLAAGETELGYDGQFFFDTDHRTINETGAEVSVSNKQAGGTDAWYLLDTTKMVRPLIWQVRETYDFQAITRPNDEHVFLTDKYLYGVRARVNAGFGLWQLAYKSNAALDAANYEAARQFMMALRGDQGQLLGIVPDMLVIPPALEGAAKRLIVAATGAAGASNEWAGSAELVMTPYLT